MTNEDQSALAIEAFADVCEAMDDYARDLRGRKGFTQVRAGADIRRYDCGWRLEKYIEAELNSKEGQWAAWWIELGRDDKNWIVSSHVSISHTDHHFDLDNLDVQSSEELPACLRSAFDKLKNALQKHVEFKDAVSSTSALFRAG